MIAHRTKAHDLSRSYGRYEAFLAEFFAAVNLTNMHLDDRKSDGCDSVADRDRGVRVGGGIYDDTVKFAEALLDFIDEFALEIALKKLDLYIVLLGKKLHLCGDILHLHRAVYIGLARAQHVDIRALDDH